MNLEAEILKEHSRKQVIKIGCWIGENSSRFERLMDLFLHGEYIVTQRSAWIVSYCGEKHPDLPTPWLPAMLVKMLEPGVHVAVKRNVLRVLQSVEIPRSLLGKVMTICFDEMASPGSPIAVRAYAMAILVDLAGDEPEIIPELRAMIQQMLPHAGPGLRACIRKALKKMKAG
jgi:hypothetical protein